MYYNLRAPRYMTTFFTDVGQGPGRLSPPKIDKHPMQVHQPPPKGMSSIREWPCVSSPIPAKLPPSPRCPKVSCTGSKSVTVDSNRKFDDCFHSLQGNSCLVSSG